METSAHTWDEARALCFERDEHRCLIGHLFGAECHPTLDAHHITPVSEGGARLDLANLVTLCHTHHPLIESLRRRLRPELGLGTCRHSHRYSHAVERCRLDRLRELAELQAA